MNPCNPYILYVEPQLACYKLMKQVVGLSHFNNFNVIHSYNGKNALELATIYQPCIILSAMELPDMSGLDFVQRIRRNCSTKHIPILAVSENTCPEYIASAHLSGVNAYITKPLHPENIFNEIEELIKK